MFKEFIKGNEAIAKAAALAGCTQYYGYPITPSSEIIHAVADYFPKFGGTFVQAESEVAAINMAFGAAACGKRVMTASSSPGISLKQEGVSYLAGAELPCVIIDIMRAGPGLGNIWPEQGDYHQIVKGGGHGNYKTIVLAPNSPQEMCDFTILAFELAEKYRGPVYVLSDAYTGQVMEPVIFPDEVKKEKRQDWAIYGDKESSGNVVYSIQMNTVEQEKVNLRLDKKYREIEKCEARYEEYLVDDAEMIVVSYGISSRIAHSAVDSLREEGFKVGMFTPKTLWPYPVNRLKQLSEKCRSFAVLELSNGQMVEDVRLTVEGKRPVDFYGRMGGAIPSQEEVIGVFKDFYNKY
ncbi:MAG: 3-methyl-2-oxobutanoate dehydrogenase subunit VorB [Bacteriovoracaceae bacterium]|jgi:2-oxoisovalerate ferredoxin oxidoreductase alpha subunit|nr:3-methyl-2-oxobutanoate dehydrogenase subunit VorB [Bacteriovoracaceae bacterium]